MPSFSRSSLEHLETCEEHLQHLFKVVVKKYDCSILSGYRTKGQQTAIYRAGRSKVEWPNSKHNIFPARGVDVAPYPIDWNDTKRFYHFAGYVQGVARMLGIRVKFGGDWDNDNDLNDQSFNDLVHFELM